MAGLSFLNPYFLLGLLLLPVLWRFLRVMPPAPQQISLPTAHFLQHLSVADISPARTPRWLLILRMAIFSMVILALARPVFNPDAGMPGLAGPVRIVLDNGWEAAPLWDMQISKAQEILLAARQEGRPVTIAMTALPPGGDTPFHTGLIGYGEARAVLDGAQVRPWPAAYGHLAAYIEGRKLPAQTSAAPHSDLARSADNPTRNAEKPKTIETGAEQHVPEAQNQPPVAALTYWLGTGTNSGSSLQGMSELARAFDAQGRLYFMRPASGRAAPLISDVLLPVSQHHGHQGERLQIVLSYPAETFSGSTMASSFWMKPEEEKESRGGQTRGGRLSGASTKITAFSAGGDKLAEADLGDEEIYEAGLGGSGEERTGNSGFSKERKPRPSASETDSARQGTIERTESTLEGGAYSTRVSLSLSPEILANTAYIRLSSATGAGATYLLGDRFKTKKVGIVASSLEGAAPLVEPHYYLKKALGTYARIKLGTIEELLTREINMLVLPDIASMPDETQKKLQSWVEEGGLLLYFAGPNIAENPPSLSPVLLRKGGRALEGIMTWEKPLQIAKFDENSPFYGFQVPEEVRVRQMVLAQPAPSLEEKSWARLSDGTPLITAQRRGAGQVVMVHTAATPRWSDLPISGLFVQILQRLTDISGYSASQTDTAVSGGPAAYRPVRVLDGSGTPYPPPNYVRPVPADEFAALIPGPYHPPGIYGRGAYRQTLNLGERIRAYRKIDALPGAMSGFYGQSGEKRLMPVLLSVALVLALIDWLISMILGGAGRLSSEWVRRLPFPRRNLVATGSAAKTSSARSMTGSLWFLLAAGLALGLTATAIVPTQSFAETPDEAVTYANNLHLAYVRTPNERVNETARLGLEQLAGVLSMRTSVEPGGVAELDLARDSLSFYPLIYWPVTADFPALETGQAEKVQNYLDNGGMILFDTQDEPERIGAMDGITQSSRTKALRRLLADLNVPPLVPVPHNHVLTKSFYLLQNFPGRYSGGTLWVERASSDPEQRTGLDGVTTILIGSHDWAEAWASYSYPQTVTGNLVAGGPDGRRQEMALRFGVNLVMYALTGNYKSDQVHLPFILERLGQ